MWRILRELIRECGDRVDLWIITHAHNDHFGGLATLLATEEPLDFSIGALHLSFPPLDWLAQIENGKSFPFITRFLNRLAYHHLGPQPLKAGMTLNCGGISMDILHDERDYASAGMINDTSIVLRMHFPRRDVLFLGDLGWDSGALLQQRLAPEQLRCDIVQMAHHGQRGVTQDFYNAVRPKICLYPTPDWLWHNDNGGGENSGPWETLKPREWMRQLNVELSCPCAYGDYLLE